MKSLQEQLIEEELKRTGGNLSKVARSLGINFQNLRVRYGSNDPTRFIPAVGGEPEDITSLAKPGFELYVIAIKRAGDMWPKKYDEAIKNARRKFDAGTHEMFQTTRLGWVVQYLVPRERPVAPRSFFRSMNEQYPDFRRPSY